METPRVNGKLNRAEWQAARSRAIASHDPVCVICHHPIDLEAPAFSPMAVEVDHKVPRARGGALYEMDNLQLTHSRCNRKKGAKMDSDYDGLEFANQVPLSNPW